VKRKTTLVISLLGVLVLIILIVVIFRSGLFRNSRNDFVQVLNKIIIGNEMIVKVSPDVDKSKIKIKLGEKTVFEQNQFLDNIGECYGGPVFDVYYDTLLIGRAGHSNTNDWYTNEYVFDFYRDGKRIKFNFRTNGRDKGGDAGYIFIEKLNDSLIFESYDPNGKLIRKWKE
jgi:hypothetical protein